MPSSTTLAVLAFAALAYYLYVPLPPGIGGKDHMSLQVLEVVHKFLAIPSNILLALNMDLAHLKYLRNMYRGFSLVISKSESDDIKTFDEYISGIKVRIYKPKKPDSSGAVVYFHGGGFVLMNIDIFDPVTREIAKQSKVTVVSVEYRLGPEHPFPAAVEDCETVTRYLLAGNGARWGIDPTKIIVAGDSAGGNLAAVVAQRLRNEKENPPIKAQILIYPLVQFHNFLLPSYREMQPYSRMMVTGPGVARMLLAYLNVSTEFVPVLLTNAHLSKKATTLTTKFISQSKIPKLCNPRPPATPQESPSLPPELVARAKSALEPFLTDPSFCPLINPDLSDLPAAFVLSVEFDVLRDEGCLLAQRMKDAHVEVVHKYYPHGFHAMMNLFDRFEIARVAYNDMAQFIRKQIVA